MAMVLGGPVKHSSARTPRMIGFVVASMTVALRTLGADPEVPTERLLYYNLVETLVTRVRPYGYTFVATFQVTHVFKGDVALGRKTFEVTGGAGATHGAPLLTSAPTIGDKGIWLVRNDGGTVRWVAFGPRMKRTRVLIVPLPARETDRPTLPHEPPYEEVVAWAKAVEQTVKAKPSERYAILKKLTESTSRPMALWAFAVLAEVDPERAPYLVWSALRGKDLPEWKREGLERILFDFATAPHRNPKQLDPPKE